jgi:hypothetical protein
MLHVLGWLVLLVVNRRILTLLNQRNLLVLLNHGTPFVLNGKAVSIKTALVLTWGVRILAFMILHECECVLTISRRSQSCRRKPLTHLTIRRLSHLVIRVAINGRLR